MSLPDRLILGFNPLLGVDHYLRERARDPQRVRSMEQVLDVVQEAVRSGARGFNLNAGPEAARLLHALSERGLAHEVGLYPMVPDERFFGTLLNQGTMGAVSAIMSGLSLRGKTKALMSGGWAYLTDDPFRGVTTYLDIEVERLNRASRGIGTVRTVLVHELITDALVGLGATDAFGQFVDRVHSRCNLPAGFVTRNFVRFAEYAKQAGVDPRTLVVLTPVNPVGFQMAPDRLTVERELALLGGENVIAMSVFGAGMVPVTDALAYLCRIRGIRSVAVGVSTVEHARTTFPRLHEVVESQKGRDGTNQFRSD